MRRTSELTGEQEVCVWEFIDQERFISKVLAYGLYKMSLFSPYSRLRMSVI